MPPRIPDLPSPRPVDVLRITWWNEHGWIHEARHAPAGQRRHATFLAVMWWPLLPVVLITQAVVTRRRVGRYYTSPTRDAVIAVRAARDGWHIEDHMSAHPGHGEGRPLRDRVFPELLAEADRQTITIRIGAATPGLAHIYQREMPGLVDVGPARPRGRHLIREPHSAA